MEVALFVLMCAQFIVLMWREEQWRMERQDLLNRLAAGQTIPPPVDITGKPPPKGGNMITAGLKRAAKQQMDALQTKEGDS